jgi:hypothetical protein
MSFSGGPDIKGTYKNCRKIKRKFRTIRPKSIILGATTDIGVASDFTTRQ